MITQGLLTHITNSNILLSSRSQKALDQASETLQKYNNNNNTIYTKSINLSSYQRCKELAEHTSRLYGKLDILINNAGVAWGEELSNDSKSNWGWDNVLDLNVKSVFYLSRECMPMIQYNKDDPGRIINIGSITGLLPQDAPTHAYDISKASVHHLTKKLARDFSPNVTVNCIAPGYIPTRMSMGMEKWGASKEKLEKCIPMGRMGNEKDISGAVIYFCSRAGSWCTGVVLYVDGGMVGAMNIKLD